MGKSTKTNRKKYELKLSLPDQRHLSYLSDGHAISNSVRLSKGESFQNFEGYLLDAIFKQANHDIGQYAAYLKAKQKETEEQTNAQESGDTESEADSTEEQHSEDINSTGLETES